MHAGECRQTRWYTCCVVASSSARVKKGMLARQRCMFTNRSNSGPLSICPPPHTHTCFALLRLEVSSGSTSRMRWKLPSAAHTQDIQAHATCSGVTGCCGKTSAPDAAAAMRPSPCHCAHAVPRLSLAPRLLAPSTPLTPLIRVLRTHLPHAPPAAPSAQQPSQHPDCAALQQAAGSSAHTRPAAEQQHPTSNQHAVKSQQAAAEAAAVVCFCSAKYHQGYSCTTATHSL